MNSVTRDLRSADWQFLLPYPSAGCFNHLVLLGGPEWLPDLVAELGLAHKISRTIPSKASADALVLLNNANVDLAEAAGCLCRGGSLYWEVERRWSSFLLSTPGAIRQRLLKAGLTPLAVYWPRPNFRRAAMYFPVHPPGALRWYVETLLHSSRFGRATIQILLRLLVKTTGPSSFGLMPRYAVTATAEPMDQGALGKRTAIASGAVDHRAVMPVVFLRGSDLSRRVIIFLFSRDAQSPSAVVKFWRHSDRNAKTKAEQATLQQIRSRLNTATGRTLPRPLGTVSRGVIVAAIESYAPGPPLSDLMSVWGRPLRGKLEDLRIVFEWISEFHRQTQISRKPLDRTAVEQWVDEPLSNYRSAAGPQPDEERLFAAVRHRARVLMGKPLPIVWGHPDLTDANIKMHGRQITVIDWSGATARLPFFDLLYFLMLWTCRLYHLRDTGARLRHLWLSWKNTPTPVPGVPTTVARKIFREVLLEPNPKDMAVKALREAISQYMRKLEIDPRFFPLLLVVNWVFRSLECFDRAEAVARGEPGANPHPGESYVEYVRLMAEETDTLFPDSAQPWWMD